MLLIPVTLTLKVCGVTQYLKKFISLSTITSLFEVHKTLHASTLNSQILFNYCLTATLPFLKHARCSAVIYRVSREECSRLREGVPYVKAYRYNPKHLCPKLNGYGDNGQRKLWSSGGSTHCTCQLTVLPMSVLECGVI